MEFSRLRRLRKSQEIRDLLAETKISVKNLIMPYFVIEGKNKKEPIKSLPGICRLSLDNLIKDIKEIEGRGIKAVLLFGVTQKKDNLGSQAFSRSGIVQKAIRAIKDKIKNMVVITDVCLCAYTAHGHCGVVRNQKSEIRNQKSEVGNRKSDIQHLISDLCHLNSDYIDNDATLEVLAKIAISHAEAGADFVAPSAMMDGQVKAIREALDKNGFKDTGILAYSAKYASNFYGPFREALDSAPQFGDRKSYQMNYRNSNEALGEIEEDIEEGADIVMVKPALAYLDIIRRARDKFNVPIAAYNVSGEYAMVKAYCNSIAHPSTTLRTSSAERIAVEKDLVLEIITAIKRAGADLIITYHAKEMAEWLR